MTTRVPYHTVHPSEGTNDQGRLEVKSTVRSWELIRGNLGPKNNGRWVEFRLRRVSRTDHYVDGRQDASVGVRGSGGRVFSQRVVVTPRVTHVSGHGWPSRFLPYLLLVRVDWWHFSLSSWNPVSVWTRTGSDGSGGRTPYTWPLTKGSPPLFEHE